MLDRHELLGSEGYLPLTLGGPQSSSSTPQNLMIRLLIFVLISVLQFQFHKVRRLLYFQVIPSLFMPNE